MNDNSVTEISVSDIIRMFKGKGRLLLCVLLIFSILGSGVSYCKAVFFGEYGNTVKFYLTGIEDSHDLMSLLRSESFAEKLLLDENGMPPKEICDPAAYEQAMIKVTAYNEGRQRVYDARTATESFNFAITLADGTVTTWASITSEYQRLQAECDRLTALLSMYKSANADAVAQEPNHAQKTVEYEVQLEQALKNKTEFENNIYYVVEDQKIRLEQTLRKEYYQLAELRSEATNAVEVLLAPWRENGEIKRKVSAIQKSLSFDYENYTEKDGENTENVAFINVDVAVEGDRKLAEYIVDRLHLIMPQYVEKTAERYEKNMNTKCTLITPFSEIHRIDSAGTVKEAAKSGILTGISALAIYCAYIIIRNFIKRAIEVQ